MEIKIINGVKTYFIQSYEDYEVFLSDINREPMNSEDKNIKLIFDSDVKFGSFMEENHFIAVFNGYVQSKIEQYGLNIQIDVLLKNNINASTVNRAEMISPVIGRFIRNVISSRKVEVNCIFNRNDGERIIIDGEFFAQYDDGVFVENLSNQSKIQVYRKFFSEIQPEILEVKCESLEDILKVSNDMLQYRKKFKLKIDIIDGNYNDEFFNAISLVINKAKKEGIEINIVINNESLNISVDTVKKLSRLKNELKYDGVDIVYSGEYEDTYTDEEVLEATARAKNFAERIKNLKASPYEKYLMVYRYVASRPYILNEETTGRTRDLISVLNGNDIVCAGYANLLKWLCNEIGIKCETQVVRIVDNNGNEVWHSNNRVFLEDEKYGLNGWYLADATHDSPEKFVGSRTNNHYAHCLVPICDVKNMKDTTHFYSNREGSLGMLYQIPADLVGLSTPYSIDMSYYIGKELAGRVEQPSKQKLSEEDAQKMIYKAYGVIEKIMMKNGISPTIFDIDNYNYRGFENMQRQRFFGGINKYILFYLSGCFSEEDIEKIMIEAENSEIGQKLKSENDLKVENEVKLKINNYDSNTESVVEEILEEIKSIEDQIAILEEENASEEQISILRIEIDRLKKFAEEYKIKRIADRDLEIEKIRARHSVLKLPSKTKVFHDMKDFMVERYYNWVEVNQVLEQRRKDSKPISLNNFYEAIVASYVAEGYDEDYAREMAEIEINETIMIAGYVYKSNAINCFAQAILDGLEIASSKIHST